MLSPTIETLILIEHQGQVLLTALKKRYGASLKGIIGKLEAQGQIERKLNKDKEPYCQLTKEGQKFIDSYLDYLHQTPEIWNKQWTAVLFSIPEKNRPTRDKLRRYLQKEGFGNLFGSVWITPSRRKQTINNFTKSHKIDGHVIVLNCHAEDNQKLADTAWDLTKIRKQYEQYVNFATKKIATLHRTTPDIALEIKKLIFELSLIISSDPNLPAELLPNDWPKAKAIKLYQEARKKL
jgi:phenylacetic acid degradation operon negative regulatory protein